MAIKSQHYLITFCSFFLKTVLRWLKCEIFREYTFLLLAFTTWALRTMSEKVHHSYTINMKWKLLKALYKLGKEVGDHFRDDVQLTIKICDTVITPICSILEIEACLMEV